MITKIGFRHLVIIYYRSVVLFVRPSPGLPVTHHEVSQDSAKTMKAAKQHTECPSVLMKYLRVRTPLVLTVESTIADGTCGGLPASKIAS